MMNDKHKTKNYGRRGMAMLVVLFIIIAIVTVASGILYRADMAMVSGQNYVLRTRANYIAWAGLEHARALILDAPEAERLTVTEAPFALDNDKNFNYTLLPIGLPDKITDPNLWQYEVGCKVYYIKNTTTQPFSELKATVVYDPNGPKAWFTHIQHPQ